MSCHPPARQVGPFRPEDGPHDRQTGRLALCRPTREAVRPTTCEGVRGHQRVLADLIGRSESWLSQVERGIRSVDRMSVMLDLASVLHVKVTELTGQPLSLAPNGGV